MSDIELLSTRLKERFVGVLQETHLERGECTIEINAADIVEVCLHLRDESGFEFDTLIDVCGVDYLEYGMSQWRTDEATVTGFSRGVLNTPEKAWQKPRFAVVYHLLSIKNNHRLRIKVFLAEDGLSVNSVTEIWPAANWFEREAYDLFGIVFKGHPDLRRILTDYGFIGYPFRKDFPLSGRVEVRFDAKKDKIVYEPVDIEPRVLVPKVIRADNRYLQPNENVEEES